MTDRELLHEAVRIGREQGTSPHFGALVVKDGQVIATGVNRVHETNDPTAHAETVAIRAACQKLGTNNLEGCELYGSHEPCLMCFSCAAWARMDRLVYAKPASSETSDTYEFAGVNLQQLARLHTTRDIKVELIHIDE